MNLTQISQPAFRKNLLLIIIAVFSLAVTAQTPKWTHYTVASTSTQLCGYNVYSIAIDAQGNKWFGTEGGVSKFDGTNWTTYTTDDGLVNNRITSIAIDALGNIWFGTYGGVSKFDGTNWTTYTTANGLVNNYVTCIAIDAQGNKWLGTYGGGVSKFDGTNWTTYTTTNGLVNNYITSIAVDAQGNKWLGTFEGVSKFDDTSWSRYTEYNGLARNYVTCITIDALGNKWFGANGGISKFDGSTWTVDTTNIRSITSIAIDAQGNKWFGTYGEGVSKFDGTTWTTYTTSNGLVSNNILSIAIDAEGNKWLGTYGGGVMKFNGTTWTSYTPDGLSSNYITAISIDTQGNKWLGTDNGGVRFDGTTWTKFLNAPIYNMSNAIDGSTWLNTKNYLYRINGNEQYSFLKPTNSDSVYYFPCPIKIDLQGNKWMGLTRQKDGLVKFDGINWTAYPVIEDTAYNAVTTIAVDAQNNIWIGTRSFGAKKFDGSAWNNYTKSDGLISNYITSIYVDNEENIWFGTYNGLSKFNGTIWINYTSANGLGGNIVYAITCDAANNKWFCTNGGVSKFDGTNWTNYPLPNGISYFNSIAIDNNGNKWLGADNGMYKFEDGGSGPLAAFKTQVGAIFNDINKNGIKDTDEPYLTNQVVTIDTNYYTTTSNSGYFHTSLTHGKHTIEYKVKDSWTATTETFFPVTISSNADPDTILAGVVLNNDASIDLTGQATRAGFSSNYWITYVNYGNKITSGKVVFTPDSRIEVLQTNPQADTITSHRIVWNFSDLGTLQYHKINVVAKMPGISSLGDTLASFAKIVVSGNDVNLSNNTDSLKQRITGSVDPNDKLVIPEGSGSNKAVQFDTPLTYTIRFQNTGTDTAFNINIRDTLNTSLDISTLSVVASSHPVTLEMRANNEAIFHFYNILLPDSNVNEPASNGFVKYSIKPKANLAEGTVITNRAHIYFDFNPPVATNEVMNTLVQSLKKSQTITFDPVSVKTYGDAPFELTAVASSGLPVSYTSSNENVATLDGNSVTIVNAGASVITVTQGGTDTYHAASVVKHTLTVNKALLTVTADNKSRKLTEPNPPFTISYSGFVNGETEDVLDVKPQTECIANISSSPGRYPIWVSGGRDNNYAFTYADGSLVIERTTGISDIDGESSPLYPNPATDYVIINGDKPLKVQVYNLQGQKMFENTLNDERLDISSLNPGLYIININGVNYKLMKQ